MLTYIHIFIYFYVVEEYATGYSKWLILCLFGHFQRFSIDGDDPSFISLGEAPRPVDPSESGRSDGEEGAIPDARPKEKNSPRMVIHQEDHSPRVSGDA